jgi:hypothetical protein
MCLPKSVEDAFIDALIIGHFGKQIGDAKGGSNILLKKNEILVFDTTADFYQEKIVSSGATHKGVSVRLAKGLWYRTGATKGEKTEEIAIIDSGKITLTNKRLIFVGQTKNIQFKLQDINSIEVYDHGICISRDKKVKNEYFVCDSFSITSAITDNDDSSFKDGNFTWKLNNIRFINVVKQILSN